MKQLERKVWSDPYYFVAFGFGSGLLPWAPGTWGTLVGLAVYMLISLVAPPDPLIWLVLTTVAFLGGVVLCDRVSRDMGEHDHGGIVWDEITGIWLVLVAVPPGWYWLLLAFILFRVLDIVKPWPIAWIDSRVKGGVGIMLDDLLAAIVAWLVIQLAYGFLTW